MRQQQVDNLKRECLEDVRQTEWDLADDLRDVMHVIASAFHSYPRIVT